MARSPKQDRAWRHNAMRGQVVCLRKGVNWLLDHIQQTDTATPAAQAHAATI